MNPVVPKRITTTRPDADSFTTTAANFQGEGVYTQLKTINNADLTKVLYISFDYEFDVTQLTGDWIVYIKDNTNGMVQPVGFQIQGGVSGGKYRHTASFQTASNSTSYRLYIHRAVTTATAVNLKIDNVVVSSLPNGGAAFIKPTITRITATGSSTYTTPANVAYIHVRAVGPGGGGAGSGTGGTGGNASSGSANTTFGTALLTAGLGTGATANNNYGGTEGTATIASPAFGTASAGARGSSLSGNSAITNVSYSGGTGGSTPFGGGGGGGPAAASGSANAGLNANGNSGAGGGGAGTAHFAGNFAAGSGGGSGGWLDAIITNPAASYPVFIGVGGSGGAAGTSGAVGGNGGSGYIEVTEYYNQPGSTALEGDGRVVAATYSTAAGQSIPNNTDTIVDFGTKVQDTLNAVTTGGSWKFTAQSQGTYEVNAFVEFTNGGGWAVGEEAYLALYKNGGSVTRLGGYVAQVAHSTYVPIPCATRQIELNAGDYIDLRVFQNSGASLALLASGVANWVSIKRLSGASIISTDTKIIARYTSNAATSIANGTPTIHDFATRIYDSHGAVTTGASWKFTAPKPATYRMTVMSSSAAGGGWASTEEWSGLIYKNGVEQGNRPFRTVMYAGHTVAVNGNGSAAIKLLAGDYIDLRVFQNSGAALNTDTDAALNHVEIEEIGNY